MSALVPGQSSSCANPVLDMYSHVNGILTDLYSLEYIIENIIDPLVPVQVYPPSGHAVANIAQDCPTGDRLGLGHYVARWTAPVDEAVGTHRVTWYFRLSPSTAEQTFAEEFEILPEVVASGSSAYALVSDLRAEGLTSTQVTDARLQAVLYRVSRFIDRATGNFFEARARNIALDGTGTRSLLLGVPVIAVSEIRVDGSPIDLTNVKVYNRHLTQGLLDPDDRMNPQIEYVLRDRVHVLGGYSQSVWSRRYGHLVWPRGTQNVEIDGLFGYTEVPDGATTSSQGITPELIRHLTVLLALREWAKLADGSTDAFDARNRYRLTSESTEGQSYSLGPNRTSGGVATGLSTGDPDIDELLASFQSAMRLGAA